MQFVAITIVAVAGILVALSVATAKPIPNLKAGGMAIPLTRNSSILNSNKSIDLDEITSHGISVREKILCGLDNYEMNTRTMHSSAVKQRSESGLGRRGGSAPLISYRSNIWMTEIWIGTPPKILNVHIDTATADMWVLRSGCSGISRDRGLWDPNSSESAVKEGQPFQTKYSDGTIVKGDRYTDDVTIAGFTAEQQTFGSVTAYISEIPEYGYADGILGLAFPSISKFDAFPLFASLIRQGSLINPTFSLKLSSSGAEMYVGGANSMLYKGDIAYTPVTQPGLWRVSMDDVRVNDDIILENVPAVFDTGANLIFGDWDRVLELYRRIGGTLKAHKGFYFYHLPCDSFPKLSFTFGGKSFQIPPEDLRLRPIEEGSPNCFSAIVADNKPIAFWHIGIPFLQGVYSVFDYTTKKVGFAELV